MYVRPKLTFVSFFYVFFSHLPLMCPLHWIIMSVDVAYGAKAPFQPAGLPGTSLGGKQRAAGVYFTLSTGSAACGF